MKDINETPPTRGVLLFRSLHKIEFDEVFMEQFFKAYWKTLLFFTIIGLIGGFFVGIYQLESFPAQLQQQMIDDLHESGLGDFSPNLVIGVMSAYQSALYGFILGMIGILLGKKTGLWNDETKIEKKPLVTAILLSVVGGLAMILFDIFVFGKYSQPLMDSYTTKPGVPYLIATVTYGAVIEEVMLRLFFMSLIAFLLYKLFEKKKDKPSTTILVISNVIASLLFAAGHLPLTSILFGLTPMFLFRCFLLNGGLGFMFGCLYQKYGLRYSMIAHGGCHIVSKLIWILFL